MTKKTREQYNAESRAYYHKPENVQKAKVRNRLRYLKSIGETGECKPFYGISFNSKAVQSILKTWGG